MYFCFYTVYFYIVQLGAIVTRSINATCLLCYQSCTTAQIPRRCFNNLPKMGKVRIVSPIHLGQHMWMYCSLYTKSYSVTAMLNELNLHKFDSLVDECRSDFQHQIHAFGNGIVHLCYINVLLYSRAYNNTDWCILLLLFTFLLLPFYCFPCFCCSMGSCLK